MDPFTPRKQLPMLFTVVHRFMQFCRTFTITCVAQDEAWRPSPRQRASYALYCRCCRTQVQVMLFTTADCDLIVSAIDIFSCTPFKAPLLALKHLWHAPVYSA